MAGFDEIFTSSNLDENRKRAQMIFGRLLISLRKGNKIKLYSMLGSVSDKNIVDNVLKLTLSDNTAYDMLNNVNDLNVMREIVKSIDNTLDIEILGGDENKFDMHIFENFLKDEFGRILTIKQIEK